MWWVGGWQINGVCVSPTGKQSGSPARRVLPEPVRRSKSQGTSRKLQKCLSTVSYSDDGLLPPPRLSHQDRTNLLVSRQYCSFGSTVTFQKLCGRRIFCGLRLFLWVLFWFWVTRGFVCVFLLCTWHLQIVRTALLLFEAASIVVFFIFCLFGFLCF